MGRRGEGRGEEGRGGRGGKQKEGQREGTICVHVSGVCVCAKGIQQ